MLLVGSRSSAHAQTQLNLSANGSNAVDPDEIVASLDVQATSPNASTAQAGVNSAMKQALDAAHAVKGVTATTGSYNVNQNTSNDAAQTTSYQASQSLQIVMESPGGAPPDAFTALTGRLQQAGLLLNSLDGELSDKGQSDAQQGAINDALRQIQAQAAAIASTLGERVGKIQTLSISVNMPGPLMRAAPMMMMAATASPPPQAAPGQVTVQANVSATIGLMPRP